MRNALREALQTQAVPDHFGLAYDTFAPIATDPNAERDKQGKVPTEGAYPRADWLRDLSNIQVAPGYDTAFRRWKSSFPSDAVLKELKITSRLLIGHGNPSASEVGLTVHHTWGVPVIPGSALKGLCARWLEWTYGKMDAAYKGVTWNGVRIDKGPGSEHRSLFGAPPAKDDDDMRAANRAAGTIRGSVTFHDALYAPTGDRRPFAEDVLTVHQKAYYDSGIKYTATEKGNVSEPNDYDDPNPVSFITVRPHTKFLIALTGDAAYVELAKYVLCKAIGEWGLGGKTSSGYGRGALEDWIDRP